MCDLLTHNSYQIIMLFVVKSFLNPTLKVNLSGILDP